MVTLTDTVTIICNFLQCCALRIRSVRLRLYLLKKLCRAMRRFTLDLVLKNHCLAKWKKKISGRARIPGPLRPLRLLLLLDLALLPGPAAS